MVTSFIRKHFSWWTIDRLKTCLVGKCMSGRYRNAFQWWKFWAMSSFQFVESIGHGTSHVICFPWSILAEIVIAMSIHIIILTCTVTSLISIESQILSWLQSNNVSCPVLTSLLVVAESSLSNNLFLWSGLLILIWVGYFFVKLHHVGVSSFMFL